MVITLRGPGVMLPHRILNRNPKTLNPETLTSEWPFSPRSQQDLFLQDPSKTGRLCFAGPHGLLWDHPADLFAGHGVHVAQLQLALTHRLLMVYI